MKSVISSLPKSLIFMAGLSLIASLSITTAHAKTAGNYLGLDFSGISTEVKSNSNAPLDRTDALGKRYRHERQDNGYGIGASYRYAFNFYDFFIAPGLSYDVLNSEAKASYAGTANDPFTQSVKLKNRSTLQINFGYDISDQFAAYVPVGISAFRYEIKTSDTTTSGTKINTRQSGYIPAGFVGFGLSYQPIKNLAFNLEWNKFQKMEMPSHLWSTINRGQIVAYGYVDMVKLGIAVNF